MSDADALGVVSYRTPALGGESRAARVGIIVASLAVALGVCSVPAGARAEEQREPQPLPAAAPEWQEPTPSATQEPAALAATVSKREAARVVSVVAGEQGPRILTEETVGPAQTRQVIAAAQEDQQLVAVGVDQKVRRVGRPERVRTTSSDPLRSQQWGMDLLSVESVWSTSQGEGVVVAVVDSGVDGSHRDLAVALVPGINTRTDSGDISAPNRDPSGHGTHVAGIIAATPGNGTGVVGVAPKAQIMPVKVLDADGSGWMSDVVEGIRWAVDHGAGVINLSLGGDSADFLESVIQYAVSRGVTVVAAAGNEGTRHPSYPAAFPGVVSVAALDPDGTPAVYSNYGPTVDLAAPGSDIVSTYPGGYEFMSGTSMATPHVAGVAALVRSVQPDGDIAGILTASATDRGPAGRDDRFGFGLVNPGSAVRYVCGAECQYQPPSPTLRQQSVPQLARLRVGRKRALPATTRQGVRITQWRATNAKCLVRRVGRSWRVTGRFRGICRLRVSAAATAGYAAFADVVSLRVLPRR